jgi:hypothetical protein
MVTRTLEFQEGLMKRATVTIEDIPPTPGVTAVLDVHHLGQRERREGREQRTGEQRARETW